MADNLKEVGKGDRIRASLQKHEVRAAGSSREKVYAYIKAKKKRG